MKNTNEINLEEVKVKLYERLRPSGWGDKLKTFILSSDFDKILEVLLKEAREGQRFTPPLKQIFRVFEECPYDKLKVIIIGQDPYPQLGVADGIAFSCSNTKKVQPSLAYIFKEIEATVYPDGYTWDPDLTRWANQGVLLINTAFTTGIGTVGRHYALWQPFMAFLFDILTFQNPGLIYVFMGAKAKEWSFSIPDNNHKMFTTHPAFAAHTNNDKWQCNDIFNNINSLIKKQHNENIIW
jgi:uracil-DNA glycosylase